VGAERGGRAIITPAAAKWQPWVPGESKAVAGVALRWENGAITLVGHVNAVGGVCDDCTAGCKISDGDVNPGYCIEAGEQPKEFAVIWEAK
jgi:hypothetical protein